MSGSPPANCGPFCSYALRVDWNNDGDYTDPNDAITNDALEKIPIAFQYGRDQARAIAPVSPGVCSFTLCNAELTYSPGTTGMTGSPISPDVLPGRKVQFVVTPTGGAAVTGFAGRIDDLSVNTSRDDRSVEFVVADAMQEFSTTKISTVLSRGIRTGTAIGLVLDAVGWPAAARDIDAGMTQIEYWVEDQNSAGDAIAKLIRSEGPPSIFYIEGGVAVFKDRTHRIIDAKAITSQATYCVAIGKELPGTCVTPTPCATGSFKYTDPVTYDHGLKNIINSVTFSVEARRQDSEVTVLWAADESLFVPASGTLTITAQPSELFTGAIAPCDGVDGDWDTAALGACATLSRTSGKSTNITFTNSVATIQEVANLQLRGYAIPVNRTVQVTTTDAASIAKFGQQDWDQDVPWANERDAQAIADIIVATRKDAVPVLGIRTVNGDQPLQNQITARRISDRVTIRSDRLGINEDFFVERIEQSVSSLGRIHAGTLGCERAVSAEPSSTSVFLFDGGAGHRFNEGVFAL